MKFRGWTPLMAIALLLALAGCSRTDPSIVAQLPDSTGAQGTTDTNAPSGPVAITVNADPSGQLKFAETTLNAVAGQPVNVTFTNPAPVPHSWVLIEPGQEEAVDEAATAKNGDISGVAGVIAGTAVLNANGTETVQVPAQPAGEYMYICTVPGHYAAGMKGTLVFGAATAAGGEGSGAAAASGAAAGGAAEGGATAGGGLAVDADPTGQIKFQQAALEVAAGQDFSVQFTNQAPVQHNWVLVAQGQEDAIASAALATNGDPTGINGVIASGKPIQGSSERINVPAQQAGTYSYICTVPGHYAAGMKGTLTVK